MGQTDTLMQGGKKAVELKVKIIKAAQKYLKSRKRKKNPKQNTSSNRPKSLFSYASQSGDPPSYLMQYFETTQSGTKTDPIEPSTTMVKDSKKRTRDNKVSVKDKEEGTSKRAKADLGGSWWLNHIRG